MGFIILGPPLVPSMNFTGKQEMDPKKNQFIRVFKLAHRCLAGQIVGGGRNSKSKTRSQSKLRSLL